MFINDNDGIIRPILDLLKKKVKNIKTTILVGHNNYVFILIEIFFFNNLPKVH